MGKRKIVVGAALMVLLVIGLVWAVWYRDDPQLERIRQLHAEAFKEGQTPEQRRQSFERIRQEMEKLSPAQRETIWRQGGEEFGRRMDQHIDDYFALAPKERVAFLDKEIKEMESRRQQWEAHRPNTPPTGAGPGGNVNPPPPPRGPRDNSPGARTTRHNQRLDHSTPEQRAKRSMYFAALQKRRYELGLPTMPPRGPGPGPPGPR